MADGTAGRKGAGSTIRVMREDEVRLRVGGEVTVELLSAALTAFTAALSAAEASHDARIRWVVADLDYGSAVALVRAVPDDDRSEKLVPQVCLSLVETGRSVAAGVADAAWPMTRHLTKLQQLADEEQPVTIECASAAVEFALGSSAERASTETDRYKSLGTVRGRVEMLSHRRGLHFSLYDLVDDAAVTCYPTSDMEAVMRNVWGRLADVTGTVRRDPATDRPRSIRDIISVDVVEEGSSTAYRTARGVLTTREPAEVLVRRMRDDQ